MTSQKQEKKKNNTRLVTKKSQFSRGKFHIYKLLFPYTTESKYHLSTQLSDQTKTSHFKQRKSLISIYNTNFHFLMDDNIYRTVYHKDDLNLIQKQGRLSIQ